MSVSTSPSRSASIPRDEELRLPRAPGVFRQFWGRHPLFTDILIALFCLILTAGPLAASYGFAEPVAQSVPFVTGLIALGACVLLLKRRQWPVVIVVASVFVGLLLLVAPAPTNGPLFAVAIYGVAVYRSARAAWIALGVGLGATAVIAFALSAWGAVPVVGSINTLVGQAVLGLIGALIGINIGNRRRYLAAVIARSHQLLVERDQHAQLAAAAERNRIAREMHDIVSHSLTVVVALSEGAAATPDQDRARAASTAAAATARSALTEMRSMLGVLRDGGADAPLAPLDPVSPAETVAAARRAGFTASLTMRGQADATPALRFAIGRIVQEGVTNAMRHAVGASSIDVRIDHADPVIIEIVNDGVSGPASEGGFGLRGLAERAELLGGIVVSAPAGRERWMLRAELPATPATSNEDTIS